MTRIASFVVLLAILLGIAVLFFRVLAEFLLPMFLAAMLVILFKPLHEWFYEKCWHKAHVAAALTTLVILVVFLVPLMTILVQASAEGVTLYEQIKDRKLDLHSVSDALVSAGAQFGVELKADELEHSIALRVQQGLAPIAVSTTQFVGNFILGLIVMLVSLYFFLLDGPQMIESVMHLSPLDNRYEEQLVAQFGEVSRSVVLATVAAAITQGLLGGLGYYLAGLKPVFLLMVLTMLLAMIPFVGAISVWLPCSLWLFFVEDRYTPAILLAIWGAGVVSTIDNVIKPLILHGRSNLHPLLALLSVLGGVKALGPIGIFVGPMVVAFLQTLLKMVQTELEEISRGNTQLASTGRDPPSGRQPAGGVGAAEESSPPASAQGPFVKARESREARKRGKF